MSLMRRRSSHASSHPNLIRTVGYGTTAISLHRHGASRRRNLMDEWDTCAGLKVAMRLDMSAWIIARVAEGLHYAHELTDSRGRIARDIHRDVNPSTFFLTYDGESQAVRFWSGQISWARVEAQAGSSKEASVPVARADHPTSTRPTE